MAVDTLTFSLITVVYLVILIALGYLGYKKTKAAEDYMLAGRNVHPALIALSYGATFISTAAIIGFGGVAAQLGMGLIWLVFMNIALGILIAFVVFGKPTRAIGNRLKAHTFPDLLGKIYKSPFLQYATAFVIIVGMPLYTSAVMIGCARFIESCFGIDYTLALLLFAAITAIYVIIGGLLAVIYTDSFQGVIMILGMTILLIFTFVALGGVFSSFQALTDMANLVPAKLAAGGHNGWTAMPDMGSSIWYTMVTTIIFGVGIGVLAQPQLAVRFMTAKDNKALNRAVPIGAFFIFMMVGVAYTIGALSNVYFYQTTGKLAMESVPGGNLDMVIPVFINAIMPDWFVVLFMLTMLSAAMSTLSALLHTMGTAIGFDVISKIRNTKPSVLVNRVGVLIMLLISLVLAFMMPISIIARATAMFMGLCAAAFLPAYTHGLFSKKPSAIAAKCSLLVGAVSWFLWTAFVHVKESEPLGICKLIFGTKALLGEPWTVLDPLFIALPLSTITLVVLWLATRQDSPKSETPEEKATV